MKVLIPLTLFIAVLALIAAGVGLAINQPKSYSHQIAVLTHEDDALRAHLASANQQISTLKAGSQAGAVTSLQNDVGGIQGSVHRLQVCIPQMQQEINSMNIQQASQGGFVTNAYIQNPTIISRDCTRTLQGQ